VAQAEPAELITRRRYHFIPRERDTARGDAPAQRAEPLSRRLGSVGRSRRHQLGYDLAAAGDGDFSAALNLVEQRTQLVLGIKDTNFLHGGCS
jgi:acyl-coenzyme A thioesterase PaaI-like protein